MNGPDGRPDYQCEGSPPPHGPGARKQLELLGYSMIEETLELEAPALRRYHMISGAPVDRYTASVELESEGEGTLLVWSGDIEGEEPAAATFCERAKELLEVAASIVAGSAESR